MAVSEKAAEREAREMMAALIVDSDKFFSERGHGSHPCIIGDGPSELVFIDSLKSYPHGQKIPIFFTFALPSGKLDFEVSVRRIQAGMKDKTGLNGLYIAKAQVIGAQHLFGYVPHDDCWAFSARVKAGRGIQFPSRFMAGIYFTKRGVGYFDFTLEREQRVIYL